LHQHTHTQTDRQTDRHVDRSKTIPASLIIAGMQPITTPDTHKKFIHVFTIALTNGNRPI